MATVVVLNGASSSGKTTLARAFQDVAPRIFLNFSIDNILQTLPAGALARIQTSEDIADLRYPELARAFYACVRQLLELGHDLVIDNAVTAQYQAELLQQTVTSHRAIFVGVECSVEVAQERERMRGDRRVGLAAQQQAAIHKWLSYDLIVDMSSMSPRDAAVRIVEILDGR